MSGEARSITVDATAFWRFDFRDEFLDNSEESLSHDPLKADSNATTAPTTTCDGYFETLSSDLASDVESLRTTFGEQQQPTCTWQGCRSNACKTFLGTIRLK